MHKQSQSSYDFSGLKSDPKSRPVLNLLKTAYLKKNKIPRIKLPKEVKNLYLENYWRYYRWNVISCSWIGRINIVKRVILPKVIYGFSTIPTKMPMISVKELGTILKFMWKYKRLQKAKALLRQRTEVEKSYSPTWDYITKLQ